MTPDIGRPAGVLAVVNDGGSRPALFSATALAERHGAVLDVLACVEPPYDLAILARLSGRDPSELVAEVVERTREEVRALLAATLPDRRIEPHVKVGTAYLEIVRHVLASGCDFVVKHAEPLAGVSRFLFASTDQHLLRKCPCPVWLQTRSAPTTPERVLAAVDLDVGDAPEPETLASLNGRVMDAARAIATAPDAEVIVVHAWEAIGEGLVRTFSSGADARVAAERYVGEIHDARQHAMGRLLARARKEGSGPRLVPRLVRGTPELVIAEQSRLSGADVVVMGTVGRTGMAGVVIGNTAENTINSLECPIVAIKPDGFVSPLAVNCSPRWVD